MSHSAFDVEKRSPALRGLAMNVAIVGALSLALIVLCYLFVDRPVAYFADAHIRGPFIGMIGGEETFAVFTRVAGIALPGLVGFGGVLAVIVLIRWRSTFWGRTVLACAVALVVAYLVKSGLKICFGRVGPEPFSPHQLSLIRDGIYGFFPFSHGAPWSSFPSGHTVVVTAPLAAIGVAYPKLRRVVAALLCLLTLALVGLAYHFVGDCIAGIDVGLPIGAVTAWGFGLGRAR